MLVAAFFFAIMGVLVKLGAEKFGSAELVFYRSLFGLVFIYALTRFRGHSLKTKLLTTHMKRAILGFVSLLCFFYALSELPLATAISLNYTSPLFLALSLTIMLHEKPRKVLIAAVLLGFIGVTLLLRPSLHVDEFIAGTIGLLSGAMAGVVYVHVTQLGRAGEPDWRTVFYFTLVCTLGSAIWMLFTHFTAVAWEDLPLLLGLGAVATIAQLAMTRAYSTGSPLVVGSLAYSTVLLASLFGILLWNETLSADRWLAVVIIILSGIMSVLARPKANNPTASK